MTLPSLFICHGSPLLAISETDYSHFLAEMGRKHRPKASSTRSLGRLNSMIGWLIKSWVGILPR